MERIRAISVYMLQLNIIIDVSNLCRASIYPVELVAGGGRRFLLQANSRTLPMLDAEFPMLTHIAA